MAERNLRRFLETAVFRDEADRQAALNCLEVLTTPAPAEGVHKDDYPEKCPITRRPYFMTLEHPELGMVPTYGGPYDSYTIPAPEGEPTDPWHERELRCERYDHDAGWWTEGGEAIPLRIIHEDVLFSLEERAEASPAPAQPGQEGLTDLLRQIVSASDDGDSDTHLSPHFYKRIMSHIETPAVRPVTPLTCPKCNALWLHWPAEQTGFGEDTLNCRSAQHCDYCEKAGVEQLQRLERVPVTSAAPTPPAQAADSVLEDAARYRWLRQEHERVDPVCHLTWKRNLQRDSSEWVNTAVLDTAIDKARKQGGA